MCRATRRPRPRPPGQAALAAAAGGGAAAALPPLGDELTLVLMFDPDVQSAMADPALMALLKDAMAAPSLAKLEALRADPRLARVFAKPEVAELLGQWEAKLAGATAAGGGAEAAKGAGAGAEAGAADAMREPVGGDGKDGAAGAATAAAAAV